MSVGHDGGVLDNSSSRFVTGVAAFFATMYFIQGVGDPTSGLIAQPVRSLLKSWGDSPTTIAAFMALLALPWSLKVLFGLLSDAVPLFGSRRRNYLLISSVSASVGLLALYFFPVPARRALAVVLLAVAADDRHRVRRRAGRCADGGDRSAAWPYRSSAVDSVDGGERSDAPHRCRWRISEHSRPSAGGVAVVCRALGGQLRARVSVRIRHGRRSTGSAADRRCAHSWGHSHAQGC